MRPIDQMTLPECLKALRYLPFGKPLSEKEKYTSDIADRIHDLTRWIPVEERMPTHEDGDRWGEVLILYCGSAVHCEKVENVNGVQYTSSDITHWQRITPPETP